MITTEKKAEIIKEYQTKEGRCIHIAIKRADGGGTSYRGRRSYRQAGRN